MRCSALVLVAVAAALAVMPTAQADLVQGISNQVLDEVNELFRRDAGCNCVNTSLYSTNDNIAACRKAILIETIDRIINETFEDRLVALEAAVSNAAGCFAGHTMVMKADGSMARVDSLTTGDMLKCLDEDYNATIDCPLTTFYHVEFETVAFHSLRYRDSSSQSRELDLSYNHHVFVASEPATGCAMPPGTTKRAENVLEGDLLVLLEDGCFTTTPALAHGYTRIHSYYAPLTSTGSLITENLVASSYVDGFLKVSDYHVFMSPLRDNIESNLPAQQYPEGLHPFITDRYEYLAAFNLTRSQQRANWKTLKQAYYGPYNGHLTKEQVYQFLSGELTLD